MILGLLVAWSANGDIEATLSHAVAQDEDGNVVGLIDLEAHELAGGKMRDIVDWQSLDAPIPKGLLKKYLGREPRPDETTVHLPPDEPFRVAHETIVGAAVWPEWLGGKAHDFRVELDGKRIKALIHKQSGHRRERAEVEAKIAQRIAEAKGKPADIRDLVGGPDRPLNLDSDGKTAPKVKAKPSNLPIVAVAKPDKDKP